MAQGPYLSVDPAPPAEERDVGRLREALLDEARPLFDRYRAMFALRDAGGEEAALALAEGEEGPQGRGKGPLGRLSGCICDMGQQSIPGHVGRGHVLLILPLLCGGDGGPERLSNVPEGAKLGTVEPRFKGRRVMLSATSFAHFRRMKA